MQGVKDSISKVEGSLSDVEKLGSQAKSVLSAFKSGGVGGVDHALSGVFNLCGNPMDAIAKGENLLSSVGDLAQHPNKIISKANSLIQAGVKGVSAIASAKSPEDALNGVLNLTNQATAAVDSGAQQVSSMANAASDVASSLGGGSSSADSSDSSGDSDASGGADTSGSSDDSSSTDSSSSSGSADQASGEADEDTPQEFANADQYGED
jgi:hypothetical protein